MTDIKVARAALEYDAKVWHMAAEGLADPTRAIGPLELNGSRDVMMYGAEIGIDATYNEARAAIEDLLGKAVGYFRELSGTLLEVAAEYEKQEAAGASEFHERGNDMKVG